MLGDACPFFIQSEVSFFGLFSLYRRLFFFFFFSLFHMTMPRHMGHVCTSRKKARKKEKKRKGRGKKGKISTREKSTMAVCHSVEYTGRTTTSTYLCNGILCGGQCISNTIGQSVLAVLAPSSNTTKKKPQGALYFF